MEVWTYITGQGILKFNNWTPSRTRGRTRWQAEIGVLKKKKKATQPTEIFLALHSPEAYVNVMQFPRLRNSTEQHSLEPHMSEMARFSPRHRRQDTSLTSFSLSLGWPDRNREDHWPVWCQ